VLQLTSAFSAAVNDGVYCPPVPILSVADPTGAALSFQRETCHRAMSVYVARTVRSLMVADTHNGTASSYFQQWYQAGGSDVAAKTGTDNDATDTGNSALWFVGMTPRLVSAAALVDPQNPKQTVHGLPGLPAAYTAQDVFGAFASTYWLAAYGPGLAAAPWTWPSPAGSQGPVAVPSVIGSSLSAATTTLSKAGFALSRFPGECGSFLPAGTVAYQEPPTASRGSTVVVCLSSGNGYSISGAGGPVITYYNNNPDTVQGNTNPPPIPPPAPAPTPTKRRHHHGGG
jgi:membrane peptidoglycan carboxypeptidase